MKTNVKTGTETARLDEMMPPGGLPLRVTEVSPGLHERAEGIEDRPVYRLDWVHQPGSRKRSGRYLKLSPHRIDLPPEAARRYEEAAALPATEETVVFLRTELGGSKVDLVLASRTGERWSALHRWSDTWRGLGVSRLEIIS